MGFGQIPLNLQLLLCCKRQQPLNMEIFLSWGCDLDDFGLFLGVRYPSGEVATFNLTMPFWGKGGGRGVPACLLWLI